MLSLPPSSTVVETLYQEALNLPEARRPVRREREGAVMGRIAGAPEGDLGAEVQYAICRISGLQVGSSAEPRRLLTTGIRVSLSWIDARDTDDANTLTRHCKEVLAGESYILVWSNDKGGDMPETPDYCGPFDPAFRPKIKVTGLKVPPKREYSDCCCQWEYRLER